MMGRKSSSKRRPATLAEDANAVHESIAAVRAPRVTSIADHSLNELAQQATAGLNASGVAIAIDIDGSMICRARSGVTAPEIGTPVQRDRGITGECVRTGGVVRCDDALHDPRVDAAVCEQLHIGSILIVPLLWNSQAVGVVEAFFILPNSFDDVDVEFLERVAQQIVSRVWGENAPLQTATTMAPVDLGTAGIGEQSPAPPAKQIDEPAPIGGPTEETATADLWERESDSPSHFDPPLEPVSRRRTIATASAVVIVIVIFTIVDAYWPKSSVVPTAPAPARQAARPKAHDPMAELRRAAEGGDSAAQYKLARAYKQGSGVEADPQLANAWLRTAAENGNADAQLEWARAHETSDPVDAYTWYVIAGQNGKSDSDEAIRQMTPRLTPAEIAQVRLDVGRQYLAGRALRRDPEAAYVWFRLSEWGGNQTARSEIQHVESQLTPRQVRRSEARASEWIRRHTAPSTTNENAAADVQP